MSEDETNWGIVELMGHKVVAGEIQKSEMLGKPMLRVDVPETSAYPAFTQFYGESAIYCVTFTSEDVARVTAEQCQVNPVSVYCPDLVTKEKHEAAVQELRGQIERMRETKALPEPDPCEDCDGECGTCYDTSCPQHPAHQRRLRYE